VRCLCGLGAATAAAVLFAAPAYAGCGTSDYSYAGVSSRGAVLGVSATIAALRPPQVSAGHVAGWVGVDGRGPDGQFEWLQIGLSATASRVDNELYVEMSRPGRDPRYTVLRATVSIGERHRFAVLAVRGRPGWWRAWLDGSPVTDPVQLAGSQAGWKAEVTGESWNDGSRACNRFSYAFGGVNLEPAPNRGRRRPTAADLFHDPGYALVRSSLSGFVASSIALP
jgi:hypothetical protein